jgi:ATP-dependent RNA helicase DDX3X
VKQRSSAGIDFDKYEAIPVQITGNDVDSIKAIDRFSGANLSDQLFDNLRRCGYDRPTPVQKNSIPIVLSGRDLMACAQTGSGKTCAFMVPCLESLMRSGPPPDGGNKRKAMPCGLVLAPTRELAAQIHVEASKFAFESGILCCIIYGGADMREQRAELDRGCDILIATPGRLTDMAERGNISLELIQFFILDEADRMLDMGFEPQVRQIVDSLGMGKRSAFPRQSMMFSATFPREVQMMAQDFMDNYVFITVGRVGSASELIKQEVVYAGELRQKVHALERAVKDNLPAGGLCVIFVETKRAADDLELDLHKGGVAVTAIHGDRSQTEREQALQAFKSGENPVLVATDVAARGLDIPNVALVINFDMPKQLDDYVHRIGLTGRAGRKGVAVAFVNERCTYLPELGDLLVEAKQDPPLWFNDLCRNAARRGGKGAGKGGRGNKFGGQDLRLEQEATGAGPPKAPSNVATPARAGFGSAPARNPNAYGNSGAEDAW